MKEIAIKILFRYVFTKKEKTAIVNALYYKSMQMKDGAPVKEFVELRATCKYLADKLILI